MQHLVFGAGLIGGFIASSLSANGADVRVVARPRFQKMWSDGVVLTDYLDQRCVSPPLTFVDNEQAAPVDVLWLTVKCTSLTQAIEDIAPWIGEHTQILCCQNGVGAEQATVARYGAGRVRRVMVPFNVAEPETGRLHRGSAGELAIEGAAKDPMSNALLTAVSSAVLPAKISEDMTALAWAKLQLNLGNSINALANVPVKTMLEDRAYRRVIAGLMAELLEITDAKKLTLPKIGALPAKLIPKVLKLPNWLFKRLANKMLAIDPTVRTSMWWDVENGRKTEIHFLNGAVLNAGKTLGIRCPLNQGVVDLITRVENSNERLSWTSEALVDALKLNR